jgi:hypothetical protein
MLLAQGRRMTTTFAASRLLTIRSATIDAITSATYASGPDSGSLERAETSRMAPRR